MKLQWVTLSSAAILLLAISNAQGNNGAESIRFQDVNIGGAPAGEVLLTGHGAYDPATGLVRMGGTFRCLADINQGPLSGCRAGEGIRWNAKELLPSTTFKCSGAAGEVLKTAVTDDNTVVMLAEFFRQGDGANASFTAKVFVSADDEGSDLPGTQNVWIERVGCGDAIVTFR